MQRCALRGGALRRPRCSSRISAGSPRCGSPLAETPCRRFSRADSSSPQTPVQSSSSSLSSGASALQQQLSFCCLLCGWESACTSCPFDWYGFDPRKFRNESSRRASGGAGAAPGSRASQQELQDALALLGLAGRVDAREVKAAFRAKALEWHPDCSDHEDAERVFKKIVRAYELLLAAFPSSG